MKALTAFALLTAAAIAARGTWSFAPIHSHFDDGRKASGVMVYFDPTPGEAHISVEITQDRKATEWKFDGPVSSRDAGVLVEIPEATMRAVFERQARISAVTVDGVTERPAYTGRLYHR